MCRKSPRWKVLLYANLTLLLVYNAGGILETKLLECKTQAGAYYIHFSYIILCPQKGQVKLTDMYEESYASSGGEKSHVRNVMSSWFLPTSVGETRGYIPMYTG